MGLDSQTFAADTPVFLIVAPDGEPLIERLRAALVGRGASVETSAPGAAADAAARLAPDLAVLVAGLTSATGLAALSSGAGAVGVVVVGPDDEGAGPEGAARFRYGAVARLARHRDPDDLADRILALREEVPRRPRHAEGDLDPDGLEVFLADLAASRRAGVLTVRTTAPPARVTRVVFGDGRSTGQLVADAMTRARALTRFGGRLAYRFDELPGGALRLVDASTRATPEGEKTRLDGARVVLADEDGRRGHTIAAHLRSVGAAAMVTDLSGRGLTRAGAFDPSVLVLGEEELRNHGFGLFERAREDVRLRWAFLLVVRWNAVWSHATSQRALARITSGLAALTTDDAAIAALAVEGRPFDVRAGHVGPARLLRAIGGTDTSLRLVAYGPDCRVAVDVANGMVLDARAEWVDSGAVSEGTEALSAWLDREAGRVRITPLDAPRGTGVIGPVDAALGAADGSTRTSFRPSLLPGAPPEAARASAVDVPTRPGDVRPGDTRSDELETVRPEPGEDRAAPEIPAAPRPPTPAATRGGDARQATLLGIPLPPVGAPPASSGTAGAAPPGPPPDPFDGPETEELTAVPLGSEVLRGTGAAPPTPPPQAGVAPPRPELPAAPPPPPAAGAAPAPPARWMPAPPPTADADAEEEDEPTAFGRRSDVGEPGAPLADEATRPRKPTPEPIPVPPPSIPLGRRRRPSNMTLHGIGGVGELGGRGSAAPTRPGERRPGGAGAPGDAPQVVGTGPSRTGRDDLGPDDLARPKDTPTRLARAGELPTGDAGLGEPASAPVGDGLVGRDTPTRVAAVQDLPEEARAGAPRETPTRLARAGELPEEARAGAPRETPTRLARAGELPGVEDAGGRDAPPLAPTNTPTRLDAAAARRAEDGPGRDQTPTRLDTGHGAAAEGPRPGDGERRDQTPTRLGRGGRTADAGSLPRSALELGAPVAAAAPEIAPAGSDAPGGERDGGEARADTPLAETGPSEAPAGRRLGWVRPLAWLGVAALALAAIGGALAMAVGRGPGDTLDGFLGGGERVAERGLGGPTAPEPAPAAAERATPPTAAGGAAPGAAGEEPGGEGDGLPAGADGEALAAGEPEPTTPGEEAPTGEAPTEEAAAEGDDAAPAPDPRSVEIARAGLPEDAPAGLAELVAGIAEADLPDVPRRVEGLSDARRDGRARHYRSRGWRALKRRRYDAAREAYERSLMYEPDSAQSARGLALVYFRVEDWNASLGWLRRSLGLDPDNPTALLLLGDLYEAQGDQDRARAAWRLTLDVDPGNRTAERKLDGE